MGKSKQQEASLAMVFVSLGWQNRDGISLWSLLWEDWMPRRLEKIGLMVEASHKVHTTVGMLSLPDVGVRHAGEAIMEMKTASWRTSAANSRSN